MSYSLDSIILPDGLDWEDKFSWTPVSQSVGISLTGALIIQEGTQLQGRPITLIGGNEYCWTTKDVLDSLYAKTLTAGLTMTLNLGNDGTFQVIWLRSSTPIEAEPLITHSESLSDQMYIINALHFMKTG